MVEVTSIGNPVTEKQLADAIRVIPGIKSIDILAIYRDGLKK